jgi:UDP-glucose 4-epimerase
MFSSDSKVKEKILVTGASGFLGANLCQRFMHRGVEVHAVSRSKRNSESASVRWWQGDMADVEAVRRILYEIKPDVIFHLSGLATAIPDRELVLPTLHSLLVSTVNILVMAAEIRCRRVVLAASLNEPQPSYLETAPDSPYAAAKWASSAYGRMFFKLYGTPIVIVRVFMTYGPGQDERKLIPHVILSLLNGEAPKLSSGRQQYDWIYVDDVMDGFLAAAEAPNVEGHTIDLGAGTLVPIRAVVGQLVDLIGAGVEPVFDALPDRPYEPVRVADVADADAKLGWKPGTPLEEGLKRTVDWYRKN